METKKHTNKIAVLFLIIVVIYGIYIMYKPAEKTRRVIKQLNNTDFQTEKLQGLDILPENISEKEFQRKEMQKIMRNSN